MKPPAKSWRFCPSGVYRHLDFCYCTCPKCRSNSTCTSTHISNMNLNQSILSLVQHTSGLGTILNTKQLQNPGHKQGLIPFKPTKEEETTFLFWKTSHSFYHSTRTQKLLVEMYKLLLFRITVYLLVMISSGAKAISFPCINMFSPVQEELQTTSPTN